MRMDMRQTRREFVQTVGLGALGLSALGTAAAAISRPPGQRPPNVLVIMSDEHAANTLGCYGNQLIQTPNLDQLAAEGVRFQNCYTSSPLCVPARLAFTTGKYVNRVSAWSNSCRLPSDDFPSIAHAMNAAGYESFLCGKQHYDAQHRYGFVDIGGNFNKSVMTGRGGRRKWDDTTINIKSRDDRFAEFHTGDSGGVLGHDRKVTAGTVQFVSERKRTDKPFFLFTGYLAPHFPLIVPDMYWQRYRDRVAMPNLPPGHVASQPLNYDHLRRGFGVVDTDPQMVKLGRELYHGLTNWIDDEIGKVLAALRASDVADDTVIVYTTDHGENKGDHHLWWKNCVYDTAARVPLIIRWPERWKGGQVREGVCGHVDLVQTIAQIGGAHLPEDCNGASLCDWMDDASAAWRDVACSEYYAHNIASGYAMIRQGNLKYTYHTRAAEEFGPQRQLFDMVADPNEFNNLADKPEHAVALERLHAELTKQVGADPEETEQRCRREIAVGYPDAPKGRKAGGGEE
jgi:choline-sulfatase